MTQTSDRPITLQATQIKAAAQLLGNAFQNDPLMVYLTPNADKRSRLLPSLFGVVARYCLRYGTIYTTPDLDGVACCLPPGQTIPTIGRMLRSSLRGAPVQLGLSGLLRFLHASKYMDETHEQVAASAHWYLWVLGVDPQRQGHGFGGKLVQTVLQQARAQNLPCYLETENPRNVPFYQQHGFRLMREISIPGSEVHVSALLWESERA